MFILGTHPYVLAKTPPQCPPTEKLLIREAAGSTRLAERPRDHGQDRGQCGPGRARAMLESASLYPPLISQQTLLRGHVIQMPVWMGLVMASVAQIFKQDFTPRQAAWSHYSLLWEQGSPPRDKKSPNAPKCTLQPTTFSLQRLTRTAASSHKSIFLSFF